VEIPRLILPFLGAREYLHGTTLFDAIAPFAPPDAELSVKFSQMIRTNCVALNPADGTGADATFAWKGSGDSGVIHISPLPPVSPLERRPYPEALVAGQVEVEAKRARYSAESPFSFVATLIPLHKTLLAHNHVAEGPGQWVFTRLDLKARPTTFRSIELELSGVFGSLARSSIRVEDQPLGFIYFSWLPPQS
jgi:hypothetical protein